VGLKSFRDAYVPRNTILTDEVVRAIVADAYRIGDAFGLLTEVLAVTGARCSQVAWLDVGDLHFAGSAGATLTVSSSCKGRSSKARPPTSLPIPAGLASRLLRAASGRPIDSVLIAHPRGRWTSALMREPFIAAVKAAGCDPKSVTPYALRHSAIVREIVAGIPIRIVAASHDTSVAMLERTYSKHIANHSDALIRKSLLDVDQGKVSALRRS
jgi:hypothetical protein